MRSGMSCFNGTVYKKTFLRFWPIWAASLVFWVLVLPLQGLMVLQNQAQNGGDWFISFAIGVGEFVCDGGGVAFALVFGLLAAMAVCSHLYSTRSANFMAALPIRREGLFVSHYLSGLTMLLAPNAVAFFLTLLVEVMGGMVEWVPLLFWLGALSGMEFFFYSFAVCIGMFAGHLLALPVFYVVFNMLAAAVYTLFRMTLVFFYYGYPGMERLSEPVAWLTPVFRLSEALECGASLSYTGISEIKTIVTGYEVSGLAEVGIYALAGLVLAAAALLVYRARHLETAGDVVAVRPMRPVFKYGVALCAGLFFGTLTSAVLGTGEAGLMISIILWGLAGYFVAQMLLDKSFRVFHKWKGGLAVTAAFAVLFLVVGFDLTGYETRVPNPSQVASVEIRGLSSAPSDSAGWLDLEVDDPTVIEKIVALHQAAVELRDQEYDWNSDEQRWSVYLTYHLENGSTLVRRYTSIWGGESDAEREGTVCWAVNQILTDRNLIWQAYGFDEAEGNGKLISVSYYGDGSASEASYDAETGVSDAPVGEQDFYGEDAAALLEAVKADFDDGTIGVRRAQGTGTGAVLDFYWEEQAEDAKGSGGNYWVEIEVTDTAARTVALLKELSAR